WQFPTVSMGLAPIMAIYQARYNRYLEHRGLKDTTKQKIWCFVGDGECDEPESLGALHLAAREGLDNLVFVVNCNLQRLDGPVRGNGKVIQELEALFRGAGWNVLKVVWGREWDDLLARDVDGVLVNKMNTTVDGEFQKYSVESDAYMLAGAVEQVQASTTTAFARLLRNCLRDSELGRRVVPIIPDEARTFGLDALFREVKIYAPFGQQYEPVDAGLLLSYQEA